MLRAGVRPGHRESAGKRTSGTTRHGHTGPGTCVAHVRPAARNAYSGRLATATRSLHPPSTAAVVHRSVSYTTGGTAKTANPSTTDTATPAAANQPSTRPVLRVVGPSTWRRWPGVLLHTDLGGPD